MDFIELNRRASDLAGAVIDRVPEDRLDAPTPCSRWTVRDIVEHLVDNDRSSVARVRGESTVDTSTSFAESSRAFLDVYADPEVQARKFELAGVESDGRGVAAVRFADVLVHAWDIGRAAGVEVELDEDLATVALRVTSRFPEHLRGPDGAFAHPRPAPDDAPVQVRLLAFLGRDPEWEPAGQRQAS